MKKKLLLFVQLCVALHGAGLLVGIFFQGTGNGAKWSETAIGVYCLYWFLVLVVVGLGVFQSDIFKNNNDGKDTK